MGLDSSPGSPALEGVGGPAAPARLERGSNFFLGFFFLPKGKREALSAVYSYCRLIDDIVDSGSLKKEEARKLLDFWRAEIERLYAGEPGHPVSRRLLPAVRRFDLPKRAFLEVIRGCEMDLERTSYGAFSDLEPYLQGVACAVGELMVRIFGCRYTPPEKLAEYVTLYGYAFQMTNILRDVGADLELGRIYLPEADMREAGYSKEELLRRDPSPAFERLMGNEYARVSDFYRRARSLVDFRDRPALLPAEIMARIYQDLLEEMRRGGFRVFFMRYRLSPGRKIWLAFKAWLYAHGIHEF